MPAIFEMHEKAVRMYDIDGGKIFNLYKLCNHSSNVYNKVFNLPMVSTIRVNHSIQGHLFGGTKGG